MYAREHLAPLDAIRLLSPPRVSDAASCDPDQTRGYANRESVAAAFLNCEKAALAG
jgi:hypothetical protein